MPKPQHAQADAKKSKTDSTITIKSTVNEVLDLNKPIIDIINRVFTEWDQSRDIDFKSYTSYRRIHEVISSILDEALKGINPTVLNMGLAQALVLIKYQCVRKQISQTVADLLTDLIMELSKKITNLDEKTQRQLLERVRTFLDALATLAYKKTHKG